MYKNSGHCYTKMKQEQRRENPEYVEKEKKKIGGISLLKVAINK